LILQQSELKTPIYESEAIASDIIRQVLEALVDLDENGIIHRDIKPANILLFSSNNPLHREEPGCRYTAKLADFGIACLSSDINYLTIEEAAADDPFFEPTYCPGTKDFLAPELLILGENASSHEIGVMI
jgi:serine/threonine protein kinase